MVMYRYVKAKPQVSVPRSLFVSYIVMSVGVTIILWTIWPIISFTLFDQVMYAKTIDPIIEESDVTIMPVSQADMDVTANPNTWFPTKPQKKVVAPVTSYTLSIPALGITNATIVISGDDLTQSLIHYGGTGLPGEYGNTVVFGHSTLPQFFRGTKDYTSIFATLPTIQEGDDMYVTYDGVQFRYRVYEKVVVEPNDLSPLEQKFDDSYLTLVTCVPPGTYLYRLNVKAVLVRI